MGAKTSVNNRTVVHKDSGGISTAFPDVCKTPSPGGPIPIPYPNIAKSSDTAKGSKKVKVDGNPIMLKGSNFSTSTGDEAGTAGGGVVSGKTKGKAEFINYSFDVKVEGKNVPRLGDMMLQNCGSPANTPPMPEIQAPLVVAPDVATQDKKTEIKLISLKPKKDFEKVNLKPIVNLPENIEKSYVIKITFEAEINKKEDVPIYFHLVHGKNNTVKYFSLLDKGGAGNSGFLKKIIVSKKGKAECDLILSAVGGDSFKLKASLDPEGKKDSKESKEYQVRRKLYYQINRMKGMPDIKWGTIEEELKDYYILLESDGNNEIIYKENLDTNKDMFDAAREKFKSTKRPFVLNVVVVDNIYKSRPLNDSVEYSAESLASGKEIWTFPKELWPFEEWYISGSYQIAPSGGSGNLKDHIQRVGEYTLELDFRSIAKKIPEEKRKTTIFKIKLKAKIIKNRRAGGSCRNIVWISSMKLTGFNKKEQKYNKKEISEGEKDLAVVHEIGHGVGMVRKKDENGTVNPLHYNIGTGPHCSHKATKTGGAYSGGKCVMFHDTSSKTHKFCPICSKFVKLSNLNKENMKVNEWG